MTARVSSRMTRLATGTICASLLAAISLTGCSPYSPGGAGWSVDSEAYDSTALTPKSVQLKDTRTGEVIWAYDIPVDRKIAVSFHAGINKDTNPAMPDELRWAEWPIDQTTGSLPNRLPVPGELYRRLDVFVRKAEPTGSAASAPAK